jgi:hypothetical protein
MNAAAAAQVAADRYGHRIALPETGDGGRPLQGRLPGKR